MRRLQIALFAVLISVGSSTGHAASQASVSGLVRDSSGVPQIGAAVQLLRPDMSVVATAYTSSKGRFSFATVLPGKYAIKAMGTSFLPSIRENVRVRTNTIVNLTLNTLYEVMQWLPAEPRAGDAQQDDWKWTLRSAANRPLLRWLEDGPLVVVSTKEGAAPRLKARLTATGRQGTFGENGERITAEMQNTPSNSRELLASVDFDPGSNAGIESMLGFRQDLGYAGAVQSVAAVAIHPEIEGAGAEGLDEAAMRTWETLRMGDEFEGEVGAEQVVARFARNSPNTVAAALPYVTAGWRSGDSTVHYGLTTIVPGVQHRGESEAAAWLPALSVHKGDLVLERGLHQELGWDRKTETSGIAFVVYADHLDNPVIEAMTQLNPGGCRPACRECADRPCQRHHARRGSGLFHDWLYGHGRTPRARRQPDPGELCQWRRPGDAGGRQRCAIECVACVGPSAPRPDVFDLSFRHARRYGYSLACQLSMATGRHGHPGGAFRRQRR